MIIPAGTKRQVRKREIVSCTFLSHAVVYFTEYPDFGLPQNVATIEEAKEFLLPRLADGRLKPKISDVFKLEEVSEAHRSLESNKQVGKVVLTVG